MNTKLFGQFLLEKGYLDRDQLLHALKEQRSVNLRLGELAVATGVLSVTDVDTVHFRQMCNDEAFGEAAVALGLLTRPQVADLLHRQTADRKLLGQILLAFGYMDEATLERGLEEYAGQKAGEELALRQVFAESGCADVAPTALSVMARVFRRTMGSALSFRSLPSAEAMGDAGPVWSQSIALGDAGYVLGIQAEDADARALAAAVLDMEVDTLDELARDAVGEFLNIVTGHVCGNLDAPEASLRASPPVIQEPSAFLEEVCPEVVLRCDAGHVTFTYLVARTSAVAASATSATSAA